MPCLISPYHVQALSIIFVCISAFKSFQEPNQWNEMMFEKCLPDRT